MSSVRTALAILALLATLALPACGSSSDTSSTPTPTTAGAGEKPAESRPQAAPAGASRGRAGGNDGRQASKAPSAPAEPHFTPKPHHDSGGGSGQFEEKGGDNSIQSFGGEASASDFAQAAATLHGYLDARAAGAWGAACSYMAKGLARSLAQYSGGRQASCPKLLAALSAGLPPQVLREAAIADVGALRIEGGRAFLLFTGAHGAHYFVPMASEGGRWKVAAIAPSALG